MHGQLWLRLWSLLGLSFPTWIPRDPDGTLPTFWLGKTMVKSADFGTNPHVKVLTVGRLYGLSASSSSSPKRGS